MDKPGNGPPFTLIYGQMGSTTGWGRGLSHATVHIIKTQIQSRERILNFGVSVFMNLFAHLTGLITL